MLKTESDRASAIDASVARADLINEISVLSRLRHPNLVMFLGGMSITFVAFFFFGPCFLFLPVFARSGLYSPVCVFECSSER